MKKIQLPVKDAHRLINSGPLVLVTAEWQGVSTITAVAWHMPVSSSPKLVSLALANSRFSLELIRQSGDFCINLPDYSLLDRVIYCGTYSGRGRDKFAETGLTPGRCASVSAPYIEECVGHIACSSVRIIEAGDHCIVLGEVKEVFSDEALITADGVVDIQRVKFIQHLGGPHFGTVVKAE